MGRYRDQPDAEPTAFKRNFEEIIYHFGLEPGIKETLEMYGAESLKDVCDMCGNRAVWYTSEIFAPSGFDSNEGRITRCWCHDCISEPFVDLWKAWPWTPDEKLADYTTPHSTNNSNHNNKITDHETATILCHLDHESTATDVIKILDHYGIKREKATCEDCDKPADWYHASVYDARRNYDFEAARDNTLLCSHCINIDLVVAWVDQYFTPNDELDREINS